MSTAAAQPVTYGDDASAPRWSVTRYQRMTEIGILTKGDKVELLENYIVLKLPRTPPHDTTIHLIQSVLHDLIPAGWLLRNQATVALLDSQPEPDFAIARGTLRSFLDRHPGPADVGLIIEVADTSLLRDQRDKTRIYARAGVPVYWIINLVDRRVEVYTQSSGPTAAPAYGASQVYPPGDAVPPVLDGAAVGSVAAADLLP
jgi:Uma2 family endonuclease